MSTTTTSATHIPSSYESFCQHSNADILTHQYPSAFVSESEYRAFMLAWKIAANTRALTPQKMAVYALLMGRPLGRAFSPISNHKKLGGGHRPWGSALSAIRSLSFGRIPLEFDFLSVETKDVLKSRASSVDAKSLDLEFSRS